MFTRGGGDGGYFGEAWQGQFLSYLPFPFNARLGSVEPDRKQGAFSTRILWELSRFLAFRPVRSTDETADQAVGRNHLSPFHWPQLRGELAGSGPHAHGPEGYSDTRLAEVHQPKVLQVTDYLTRRRMDCSPRPACRHAPFWNKDHTL